MLFLEDQLKKILKLSVQLSLLVLKTVLLISKIFDLLIRLVELIFIVCFQS
jgi:hypothetical protein